MNIVKIVYGQDRGGIYSCETQYLQFLKEKGVHITLVIVGKGDSVETYKSLADQTIQLENVGVRFEGGLIKRFQLLYNAYAFGRRNVNEVFNVINAAEVDAVIYRREAYMFLGSFIAKKLKTSCYWHMANSINNSSSRLLHKVLSRVLEITPIANSIYTSQTFGKGCELVVYPGFNDERLIQNSSNDQLALGIDPTKPIYGMIARVCNEKAQDLLVEGFVHSQAAEEGAYLLLAGNYSDKGFFEKIRQKAGKLWGSQVIYLGLLEEVASFYNTIDVAINSRRNAEPFGISIAEALFMKKPVISYYKGGPEEMIQHGENGWLVYEISSEAYEMAFNQSFNDKNKWTEMGIRSFEKSHKFNSKVNVEKLLKIISKQY
ncbi:glycosyltransferase family 4 protein [Mongoliitalea lutea]|uniref:Glycosyl transferase family 1 domain-containing protein n=1 Tax=Mongoliitalea lutea TaxID=849756 RepID=A0A8J3CX28_9BACT|nr:glycosyltransferase family 4 protein [Mongoliitalea lutea]GHB31517.1 hypothetical protein GCM10008106_10420 [Mongoliitalea lutea]